MPRICVLCKGSKLLCGRPLCPLLLKKRLMKDLESILIDKELLGKSVSVFVGSWNYPNIYIGPLTGREASGLTDSPENWYGLPLEKIIDFRLQLFRGKKTARIETALNPDAHLQAVQEIAMAEPVETDLVFKKKPSFEISFNEIITPFGPSGQTEKLRIESNPKISKKVDSIVSDELKAKEAILKLYEEKINVSSISKILSVGLLGVQKKLVPTKWSITATDDIICKTLLEKIREYEEIDKYCLFRSEYLGNHFEILLVPGKWSFENIEVYTPGCTWITKGEKPVIINDYEMFKGRKDYAENISGAYYAARLAVCEYLKKIKRQASIFVVREIKPAYYIPVGVWEIRENCRNALKHEPSIFNNLQNALTEMEKNLETKNKWREKSELLRIIKSRQVFQGFF